MSLEKHKKPQFADFNTPELAYDKIFVPTDFIIKSENEPLSISGRDVMKGNTLVFKYMPEINKYECTFKGGYKSFIEGDLYLPSQLLLVLRFKGGYKATRQFIMMNYLEIDMDYIMIATNYFKILYKKNRYGVKIQYLKQWNDKTIIKHHGKSFLDRVPAFDDFTIEPNNMDWNASIDGFYNLYSKFPHQPHTEEVTLTDIPAIAAIMSHIFGEQVELGYQYMKVMYERPKQKLPVLCLVSKERNTGKSTFLNFLEMLFGFNFVIIDSDTLTSSFNSSYAYKNIIAVDETIIEKASAVERIKVLATAKTIPVNMKHVAEFNVPFYGKVILATNKETDFMRIDSEEIRFWVRKIDSIKKEDPLIEDKIVKEIPMFIKYLAKIDMPEHKTRMIFTAKDLANESLEAVKRESRSGLHKDLDIFITEFFYENETIEHFKATATDMKKRWFESNARITPHYIAKVLRDEMDMQTEDIQKYNPFIHDTQRTGRPFVFKRYDFVTGNVTGNVTHNTEGTSNNDNNDLGDLNGELPF